MQETLSPGMTISMSAQRANTNPTCCQSDSDLTVCLAVWCAPTLSAACLVDSIGGEDLQEGHEPSGGLTRARPRRRVRGRARVLRGSRLGCV